MFLGEGLMLVFVVIPLLFFAYFGMAHLAPWVNWLMDLIWCDPAERQRRTTLKRLKELHVDGDVPPETAVLLAAKEREVTEQNYLDVAGLTDPSDLMNALTGKRGVLGAITNAIERAVSRRPSKH